MMSDKNLARIAGLCYLIVIATGLFSEVFVRQALRVSHDALTTVENIKAHELLFRWGIIADIINFAIGLPAVIILYHIFKRVNKLIAQLAIAFVVVQTAIIAVNLMHHITPLLLLGNDPYLNSLEQEQLATLALLSLNIQAQGYGIGLVFFGFYCIIMGYMISVSKLIPRGIGILYGIAGLGYLINSFTMFLSKGFENPFFLFLAIPIFIGELTLCLWLLIKGVRTDNS